MLCSMGWCSSIVAGGMETGLVFLGAALLLCLAALCICVGWVVRAGRKIR